MYLGQILPRKNEYFSCQVLSQCLTAKLKSGPERIACNLENWTFPKKTKFRACKTLGLAQLQSLDCQFIPDKFLLVSSKQFGFVDSNLYSTIQTDPLPSKPFQQQSLPSNKACLATKFVSQQNLSNKTHLTKLLQQNLSNKTHPTKLVQQNSFNIKCPTKLV